MASLSGTPLPIGIALEENQMKKASPANLHIPSPVFPHILTRQLPTTPELHKTCLRFKVDNYKKND